MRNHYSKEEEIENIIEKFKIKKMISENECDTCGEPIKRSANIKDYALCDRMECDGGTGEICFGNIVNELAPIKERFAKEFMLYMNNWLKESGMSVDLRRKSIKRTYRRFKDSSELNPHGYDDSYLFEFEIFHLE